MSTPRKFLTFATAEEALAADQAVCRYLREKDGNKGTQWSGVSVRDGDPPTYGILWAGPVAEVFGQPPEDNPDVPAMAASIKAPSTFLRAEEAPATPAVVLDEEEVSEVTDDKGTVRVSNWTDYVPPPPEPEDLP